jgi:hypothetical protein
VDALQSPAIDRGDASSSFAEELSPNGAYINLGAYGNTDQASHSPLQYILVANPNGGEFWPVNQTFPISWRTHDNGSGDVDIDLVLKQAKPPGAIGLRRIKILENPERIA